MKPIIEEFDNVVAYPMTSSWRNSALQEVVNAGLCLEDDTEIESAIHFRSYQYNFPQPSRDEKTQFVDSSVMYGGISFFPYFNHTVAESMGRLWADKHLHGRFNKIVFLAGYPGKYSEVIPSFVQDIFKLLQIDAEPIVVGTPTVFKKMFVPSQLYGLGTLIPPHGELVSFFRSRLKIKNVDINPEKKVFVTRSEWPLSKGGIVLESRLSDALRKNGYKIVVPESMSIEEQFLEYSTAGKLLFSEGSALHLFSLIASSEQKVAVMQRRPWGTRGSRYVNHIMGVQNAFLIDAVLETISPNKSGNPTANAASVVDFSKVRDDLNAIGFLGDNVRFEYPSDEDLNEELSLYKFNPRSQYQ